MTNLAKLEFVALDITGKNYLSWMLNVEIHLDAKGLGETINEGNEASSQDKTNDMIFLHHHFHEGLKIEYLIVKGLLVLWNTCYDCLYLRLQYFNYVSEYNSNMFRITSQLKLCGENITDEEMLEKTYSTFHKYFKLISCLLVVEQNNELLMKNYELRPTGSTLFPEVNKWDHKDGKNNKNTTGKVESLCYRYGGKNHWSRTCRTPKHLMELYQQ
ncbi:hypothetical protein V6Z12_A12G142100 [Gossypium hirsutum]